MTSKQSVLLAAKQDKTDCVKLSRQAALNLASKQSALYINNQWVTGNNYDL
jgi:hypothetical protein